MESPFLEAHGLLRYIGFFLSGVCHQFPEHSLFVGGLQLPLCARCMGTHLGALLSLCNFWRWQRCRASRLPRPRLLAALGLIFALWVIDSVNSYLQFATGQILLYNPSNLLRLFTGMGNGLLLSAVVLPLFNYSVWREPSEAHAIESWRELGTIGLQLVVVTLTLQTGREPLFYPLLAASVTGLLLTLTMVNSVIAVILLQRENTALSWQQAVLPVGCGFLLAMSEVAAMAFLRSLLTGWLPPAGV
jgi:uncharacterized membrane protein